MESVWKQFASWYNGQRLMKTGLAASPVTVRNKVTVLKGCQRRVSPRRLPDVLTDRAEFLGLLGLLHSDMTTGSVRNCLYALRDLGEFGVAVLGNPPHVVLPQDFPPKNPLPVIHTYTPEEMERLTSAAWGVSLRWGCFISFLAETGRRVGETLSLEWRNLHLSDNVPHWLLPQTKARQPQYVPLSSHLVSNVFTPANIKRLQTEGRGDYKRSIEEYPFPWAYNSVNGRMERFCERIGVENRGFHNFRHTVITNRLADGVPIQAVAALAGHTSIATTDRRYNHTNALSYASYVS